MVVGSLIAYTTYGWLLRVAPLPLVATYAYVNPVVAVILGCDRPAASRSTRERSSPGAVIVVAVALIVTARGRMAGARTRATDDRRAGIRGRRSSSADHRRSGPARLSGEHPPATRRARAMTVIIGLTPIPVGNSEPSPT